jgi:hypothetical protein
MFKMNEYKLAGFIEVIGNNQDSPKVYSLDVLSKDSVVIVALKSRHYNNTIPLLLSKDISDIYFLTKQDIDDLEDYDDLFQNKDIQSVYPNRKIAFESGRIILQEINNKYKFSSVIDFGCGSGAYLAAARMIDNTIDIKGLDCCEVDRTEFIPNEYVEIVNFENYKYKNNKKYDLAISIEVAEHIDNKYSDLFVDNICTSSDVILFSAAIPYQGGNGHVNCQWPSFWISKFRERGYVAIDMIRPKIWNDSRCMLHCRQNCLIFVRSQSVVFENFKEKIIEPLDLVHPMMVEGIVNEF